MSRKAGQRLSLGDEYNRLVAQMAIYEETIMDMNRKLKQGPKRIWRAIERQGTSWVDIFH